MCVIVVICNNTAITTSISAKNALETSKISVWSSLSFRYFNLTFVHSQINLALTYFKNVYLWSVTATLTEKNSSEAFSKLR